MKKLIIFVTALMLSLAPLGDEIVSNKEDIPRVYSAPVDVEIIEIVNV